MCQNRGKQEVYRTCQVVIYDQQGEINLFYLQTDKQKNLIFQDRAEPNTIGLAVLTMLTVLDFIDNL